MPGISSVNFADYCEIDNLQITATSGSASVSILSGSLQSLQTRQLSDVLRLEINKITDSNVQITFDVSVSGAISALRNIKLFSIQGVRPISTPSGLTIAPVVQNWGARLQGYDNATATGTPIWDTGTMLMGNYGDANTDELFETMPWEVLEVLPIGIVRPLLASADSAETVWYGTQGWACAPAMLAKSFKVTISLDCIAGDTVIDIGRLWIGNGFIPQNGISVVQRVPVDRSNVTVSRDSQAYPQYFDVARQLTVTMPALTETEAVGVGPTISTKPFSADPVCVSGCMDFLMGYLGTSRECIMWLQDPTAALPLTARAGANLVYRNSLYGRVTQWQPMAWVQGLASAKAAQAVKGRLYSAGLTMLEER